MIKIAIVDDHTLFRKSLKMLVSLMNNTSIVIEAENGKLLLEQLQTIEVDLILLDIQMPVMDGFKTCEIVKELYPTIKILVLSQLDDQDSIRRMVELGASGYFTKNSDPKELKNAIINMHTKGFHFESSLASLTKGLPINKNKLESNYKSPISERQKEIICLSARGLSSKEIAAELFISPRTVDEHKRNLIKFFNCPNFTSVILHTLKNNILLFEDFD